MVTRIGRGKQRDYHPRFLALMNHYLIEPVACTPASGLGERTGREPSACDTPSGVYTTTKLR